MNTRFKDIRLNANMTQVKFAEKIGVSRSFVVMMENGSRTPGDRAIRDICRTFGVNEDWLRTGNGSMYVENNGNTDLYAWIGDTLNEGDPKKIRFLKYVAQLEEEDWDRIISFAKFMLGEED